MGDHKYLKADYAVVCGTFTAQGDAVGHGVIRLWAYFAIILYPIGIPLAYMWLLRKVKTKLIHNVKSPLTAALTFLHGPYKPQYFWWELVLVLQKLILVGFFVLEPFQPGSFVQLMLGMSVVFIFTVVQLQVQPYRSREDNLLATVCGTSLFTFFLGSVLYRFHELTTDFDAVSAQLTSSWASKRFTLSFELISALMLVSLFGSAIMMVVLECLEYLAPSRREHFHWNMDDSTVIPPLLAADEFHAFLSHNWATGQVRPCVEACRCRDRVVTTLSKRKPF